MPSPGRKSSTKKVKNLISFLIVFGTLSIAVAIGIFFYTFLPLIRHELNYNISSKLNSNKNNQPIEPLDTNFGIVVPKIKANAKVIANVNPLDPHDYQYQLTKGVAHAQGTALPGQPGNIFIFSHSSIDFFQAKRYNSIFYLLNKLETGDEINLYYQEEKYTYHVKETKLVLPHEVKYFFNHSDKHTLTLMTCWPPGTTARRLLVIAHYKINP